MNNMANSSERVHRLAFLRALVAALGERLTPPWWRSQFLTDVGLRAIGKIFPRTVIGTAISSTTIVARGDHDKRIGVGRRYHLFRLPADLEPLIADALRANSLSTEAMTLLNGPTNTLLEALSVMAESCLVKPIEGPVGLGVPERILNGPGIAEMAAHYRMSIETSRRVFPYFEEKEKQH